MPSDAQKIGTKKKMKYTITVYSDSEIPMYSSLVRNSFKDSYITEDKEIAKKLIFDNVDCADYSLTDENIKRNFGYENISEENLTKIKSYYSFRKLIYGDLLKHIEDGITGDFKYEIPEEVNSYTIRNEEDLEDIERKEKQFDYYIELLIEK